MRVYLYMLSIDREISVRELQRVFRFKSPSTARHHLERLVALGLAIRTGNGYKAVKPRNGLLAIYTNLWGWMVPRTIAASATLLVYSIYLTVALNPLIMFPLIIIAVYMLYETLNMARQLKRLQTT